MPEEFDAPLPAAGIALCSAEMRAPMQDKLKHFALFARLGERRFFAILCESAGAGLPAHALAWVDREGSHACAGPPGCESGL